MIWLTAWRKKRRLCKLLAEAVVRRALSIAGFTDRELQMLLLGGFERPLGDVMSALEFFKNGFSRQRYVLFVADLISDYSTLLRNEWTGFSSDLIHEVNSCETSNIVEAIDPLLEYCLNALRLSFENPNGPGASGSKLVHAFDAIPRQHCGRRTLRAIKAIEKNGNLLSFMRQFVRD